MEIPHDTRRSTWGGARAGAGRPARGRIASEPHKARPELAARHPVRVTTRVIRDLGSLQHRRAYHAIRRAIRTSLARPDFRIVRVAVMPTRVELIVEADDKAALARGMQGFQVAAARYLNAACARRGNVFPDRYRSQILRSRVAVRAAIAGLPGNPAVRAAWPQTWMLRVELVATRPPRRRSG